MRLFYALLRPNGLANGLQSASLRSRSSPRVSSSLTSRCQNETWPRQRAPHRSIVTLAIETSCDDTCVAVLESRPKTGAAKLHFNTKVTSDHREFGGVAPWVALNGHTQHLARLVQEAIRHFPPEVRRPDFVTFTRGPGMGQNLAAGLNTAKGLAVVWDVPLVGVNHMQAHALTPRLVSALEAGRTGRQPNNTLTPEFPFLSLLVSGGHTMLVLSESVTTHRILVPNLSGQAIGDMLDKTARILIPKEDLDKLPDTMYAAALEPFAFPPSTPHFSSTYTPPLSRSDDIAPVPVLSDDDGALITTLSRPLRDRRLAYDFPGLGSQITRLTTAKPGLPLPHRRALAAATMRVAFDHLASRILLCLGGEAPAGLSEKLARVRTLVVSGGVARNAFLRHVLRSTLDARGYGRVEIVAPPGELCTDNAAMISWTGMEMWKAGWRTGLGVMPLKKWSVDPDVDGGILGAEGWVRVDGEGNE